MNYFTVHMDTCSVQTLPSYAVAELYVLHALWLWKTVVGGHVSDAHTLR